MEPGRATPDWQKPPDLQALAEDYLKDPGPNAARALALGLLSNETLRLSSDLAEPEQPHGVCGECGRARPQLGQAAPLPRERRPSSPPNPNLVADLAAALRRRFGDSHSPDLGDELYFRLSAKAVLQRLQTLGWQVYRASP
jgi:hypothetical protein